MDEVKVSVIIPVYQVENYLERAVDSVLAQTLTEVEIILVDDGSQDASARICDHYGQEYPEKIRVIHKENQGLGMARNTGITAARGKYVAFLDSDDAVEPKMYESLYEEAESGQYDIVMCDVKIIYVEEKRTVVVSSYTHKEIDLPDYIANGNNITYSVNKLFRRKIWEDHQYEKMLFEDIALIPSLITNYPNIGYVPEAFYHYYRRADTLSTTQVGAMADIIAAYEKFIDNSNPHYREEVIYCAAKQILWNMTDSRVLFQADFIDLLKAYESDFRLNPYIQKDQKVMRILDFIKKEVIPDHIICPCFYYQVPLEYEQEICMDFPRARRFVLDENAYDMGQLPVPIQQAWNGGNISYVEEYVSLKALYEQGGIVLKPSMRASLNLKRLRLNRIFFGFENQEEITSGCFGAVKGHYVIKALLDSYETDHVFNKMFCPLGERIRDFLLIHFQLKPNGRNQLLKNEIQVYLPSVLAYDMKNGENCCKHGTDQIPEGYELVSGDVLKLWSDRLMENWNLYKKERELQGKKVAARKDMVLAGDQKELEIQERIREVVEQYENSTCWKLTKPLRLLGNLLRGEKNQI